MPRFGFSTLGLPGRPLDAVLTLAQEGGWDGVELRCAEDEPLHTGLDRAERSLAARAFVRTGVVPLALAGYTRVAEPGPDAPVLAALRRQIWLAADVGARFLRVFPGGGDADRARADACAVRRLRAVAGLAQTCGVRILLETHDSHRAAADTARVLRAVNAPGAGALWDVLHTHLAGDAPERAFATLLPHLGYIQVKDARDVRDLRAEGDLTPVALGAGSLDPAAAVAAALDGGYDGWLVWEYEARWYPHAEPLPPQLPAARAWLASAVADHPRALTP
ncbi:sugar phosphate isomerase/epimerase [Streptacidiphilus sp. MAP12-33]|uniref:sugar phosphate isomerase/epimerase family protein n=1 Tax=Streptacidiphilus sp. MAP12-33 TaxID=3156266 RepID=UPI0035149A21